MKKIALLLLLIFSLCLNDLHAAEKRTKKTIVKIDTSSYQGIFPESWLTKKINAKAEKLKPSEVDRSRKVIQHALSKYPGDVLTKNLKTVYVIHYLEYFGISAGGTNSTTDVYIANRGVKNSYSDFWLERTFHTEFSSIILRNHFQYLDKQAWLKLNGKSFRYLGSGVDAVKNKKTSKAFDAKLNKQGFLCEYSTASFEEDFNSIAEKLLLGNKDFWQVVNQHPKLKAKTDIVIAFYHSINPLFDKEYFASFTKSDHSGILNQTVRKVMVLHHHPGHLPHAKQSQHDWELILNQLEKANFSSTSFQGGLGSGYKLTIEKAKLPLWKKMIDQLNKQKKLHYYRSYKPTGELVPELNHQN